MNPQFLQQIISTAEKESLRHSLPAFIRKSFKTINPFTPYVHNWYVDFYAEIIKASISRQLKRYIINVAPGCLKSTIFSAIKPAWVLAQRPYERFTGVSNSESLTNRNSRWTKKIIESDWYKEVFPEVKMTKETESFFETTQGGFRQSFTTFGNITGERGNYLQLDDFMSVHMVRSDADRNHALWLFDNAFENRLNSEAEDVIGVIEQRLHPKDLTGHLMGRKDGKWEQFLLPAEFQKDKFIWLGDFKKQVKAGDLIDPVRLSKTVLEEKKNKAVDEETGQANGKQMYSAQYLQEPIPDGGNRVQMDWFKRFDLEKLSEITFDTIAVSVDSAQKPEELNDPWGITKWGIKDNKRYLIDVANERYDYPDGKRAVRNFCDQKPTPDFVLIEDHSTGASLIQEFRREKFYPIIPMKTKGVKKEIRFDNCTGVMANGEVFLPERAPWLWIYEDQLMKFPYADHDDLCDSTSQFLNWSKNRGTSDTDLLFLVRI